MSNGNEWWPEWTPGFKWPWETPTGQDFQAPWTTTKPAAPIQPMQPMEPMGPSGPNYGPYGSVSEIPPELLEDWDYEPYEETYWVPAKLAYTDEEGRKHAEQPAHTERITMYRLIPKGGMSEYQRRQVELSEAEFLAKYGGEPTGETPMTEWQQAQMELARQQFDWEQQQAAWEQEQAGIPTTMTEYQRGQLGLGQQQLAAEQAWRQQQLAQEQQQYAAQLATQPKSWLEYAAYTGTPPVVQPWMLPLMPQEYAGLEGLRAGQPIPGWPEQFTGTNVAPYGGAYQPWMAQPGGIGAQPTAGYEGAMPTGGGAMPTGYETSIPASRFSALGTSAQGQVSGNLSALSNYVAQGMSPYDAALRTLQDAIAKGADPELAEYATVDALRLYWEQTGTKPTTSGLAGLQISSLGTRPETFERYGEAITNVQSGDPLLGGLSSREKMSLVGQMVNEGWDRTLAERYVFGGAERFRPYKTIPETTTPSYTPLPTREPTPTKQPTLTVPGEEYGLLGPRKTTTQYVPGEEYGLPAPTPKWEPTPSYKPTSIPMEELEPRSTFAYIPGRSWHDIENASSKALGDATWLARMEKLPTAGGTQTTTQTPAWMGASQMPLSGMPTLVRPSRQYQARIPPSALQQYYAYVQGRTGATPEDTAWRLRSMAPPGGGYSGLRWMR